MQTMVRRLVGVGTLLALMLGLGMMTQGQPAQAQSQAFVRVAHAAPAVPVVDVYVDGTKLLTGFKFGTVTGYVPLAAGAHAIAVVATGQDISMAAIKQSVTVVGGVNYTVAAIGNTSPAVTPALVAFQDDNTIDSNKAKARVYHLSDNAGPVSVAAGSQTLISSLSFQNASDYLTVPEATYALTVTLLNASKSVPLSAMLSANKVTSIFALGEVGGTGATAFTFVMNVADGVPSGQPQTGVAPLAHTNTSSTGLPGFWLIVAGLVVVALGGTSVAVARRRH